MTMNDRGYNGSKSYARETCSHIGNVMMILIILIIIKQCQMS